MTQAKARKITVNILLNILYLIIGLLMLVPIYYLVVTTFKSPAEAAMSPLGLPEHFTLANYRKALGAMDYGRALMNNVIITGSSVILLLIFASMAAYVVARSRKKMFRIMYSVFMMVL